MYVFTHPPTHPHTHTHTHTRTMSAGIYIHTVYIYIYIYIYILYLIEVVAVKGQEAKWRAPCKLGEHLLVCLFNAVVAIYMYV
jgi:hypothetical protein